MAETDSLTVATEHFYWKLEHALARAFELDEYARARLSLQHPILDLGCGNGSFSAMLHEKGVLDCVDIALDASHELWSCAGAAQKSAVQGDIRTLPLLSGSVRSVFSNGVLSSVPTDRESDIDRILGEAYRVLAANGQFVMTAPTPHFSQNLNLPKAFQKAGLPGLGERYIRGFARRVAHYLVFSEGQWTQKLAASGFAVEQVGYYLTPRQEGWYEFFALPPFWLFKGLKLVRKTAARPAMRGAVERLLRPEYSRSRTQNPQPEQAGYLLIAARKAPTSIQAG